MTEVVYYNANGGVIKKNKYGYDDHGNQTAEWTVNGSGALQGVVKHYEYDANNRVTKIYTTNLAGKKMSAQDVAYCVFEAKYDERGNIIEQTYSDANGNPSYDQQKTYKRIKKYDERNNEIYEKNLGKDGKPLHGEGVNPEGKIEYDEYGNLIVLMCYDGYGNPSIGAAGFHRLERKYNESNLLVSECYKDVKGKLVKNNFNGCAKITYTYDVHRNKTMEKYFGTNGNMTNYVTYNYNERKSLVEACMYNAAGKLDDSKVGFSKLTITYQTDGVTPVKKTFYKGGRVLAWQLYNSKTGQWSNFYF